jgi:fumarate reductase subunit C
VSARAETWLWLMQRVAAAILAVAVAVHLVTIIYAVRHGLSAAAILERTRGSTAWLVFYIVFVAAAALHGSVGLRTIVSETTRWRGRSLDAATALVAILLTWAGARAAIGLFA